MTATTGSQHDQSLPLGSLSSTTSTRLIRSFNEWDPLEEVIVGSLEGAVMPPSHITVTRTIPPLAAQLYRLFGGHRYPRIMVDAARRELEGFVKLLQAEGITVKRPDTMDFTVRARTPFWNSKGYCVACPRDGFLIVGDEIIETPMAWRSRYFEGHAFRKLFKDYFARGARWTAAPRPELRDELFDYKWMRPHKDEAVRYMITEFEPVFDAADFVRCGRDLFGIRSNVTNAAGFEWLRRHLARDGYRVHELQHQCRTAMHIDSTFVPLCPGKFWSTPSIWTPPNFQPSSSRGTYSSLRGRIRRRFQHGVFAFHSAAPGSASTFSCLTRKGLLLRQVKGPLSPRFAIGDFSRSLAHFLTMRHSAVRFIAPLSMSVAAANSNPTSRELKRAAGLNHSHIPRRWGHRRYKGASTMETRRCR